MCNNVIKEKDNLYFTACELHFLFFLHTPKEKKKKKKKKELSNIILINIIAF